MRKKFKWLLVLVAMVASVNLKAEVTDLSGSLDLTGKTVGSNAYNTSTGYGDWTIVNGANNNKGWAYFKMGGKSTTISTKNPCYIYYSAEGGVSSQVDSITVSIAAGSLSKDGMSVNSWGVYVYSDKAMKTQIDYVEGGTITDKAAKFGFKPSSGKTWAAGSYYKVSWDLANTSGTNGVVCVDKITLHSISDDPAPTEPSLSVDPSTIDFGTVYQNATIDAKQVEVTFVNLTTNDVAAAISGSAFGIDKTGSFTSGDKITITPSTANLGEFEETLTLSATSVDDQKVTITMNVVAAPVLETYNKVTSVDDLAEGDIIVLASSTTAYGVAPTDGHAYIDAMKFTASPSASLTDNVLKAADAYELTLAKSGDNWTMTGADGLVGTSAAKALKFGNNTATNTWSISIDGSANASITSTGSGFGTIQYNSGSPRFLNYASGQMAIQIYKKELPAVYSAITVDNSIENGSVSVTGADDLTSVASGTEITLSNTPASGYTLNEYDVYKTGELTTKVTIEDGKFKMPAYPVTVSATFKVAKVLNSVEITTPATKTEFWKGEEFSAEGLVLTAHFADGDEVVTPTSITGYDMATAGEQTVTVSFTEGATTESDTYEITVKSIANTKETAYTVAQAIALIDANPAGLTTAKVYVKGVITGTGDLHTDGYFKNLYIKDAGESNSFQCYKMFKDASSTKFAAGDLTAYDTIIAYGPIKKFSTSTYEFDGCYMVERKPFVAPVVVTDPSNTPETAYTPAEAIAIYDNGAQYDLTKAVYVKGVVTSKPSLNTSGDWKGSYYQVVVAAAETETPTFTFFHMFAGAESAQFTEDIINAKDTVIAYGTLTKYNTTYELAERCYMIEHKPYQAPVTGVTIDNKEGLTVPANESITLTATISEAGATGTLVWSVIAGADKASVNAATGVVTGLAAGDATIQVQVEGTSFTDQCTVTVTAAYEGATLPYNFDGGKDSENPAFKQTGLGSDYKNSPKLKFDGEGDEVVFHIADAPAYMSFDIIGNGSPWAGQFDVLESADNSSYTSVASYTELESSTTSLNVLLTGTSRYIKFVYTTKTNGNVALGNINILATAPKVDPEFSIANVDVVANETAELQITTNSDGAVTYTIEPNNEGIKIEDGVVYAYTEGTYTVTADKAETETYNAAQTTFTVTVSSVAYKTAEVSTFSAVNGGLLELGQFHSYKGGASTPPAVSDGQIRLYQNGGYIKISALPGLKIAKIDIASAMATSYNYKVDNAAEYTLASAASLAKDATANIAGLTADSVRIYCLGTDKNSRFYVSYLKVYYTGELETVSALAVAGAKVTEYEINDVVDHTDAVVTATFENAADVDVTLNSTFTDPDMSTSGTKQVTANFAEQTATYDITVKAETPEITVDVTEVPFGTVAQNAEVAAKTVAVTLKAIAEATVAVTGDASAFTVTPASLTESGNITITPVTTAAGEFAATITISADGAEAQEVALSLNVEAPDNCDGADDFETSEDKSATSYIERTTTAGWSAVNAARTKIGDDVFFTINGKTSAVGVITSPELEDGIASLKIRYANTFQEANGVSFRVDIKQAEEVVKTYTITKENADVTQNTVYTETISGINVAGTYQIVITNLSPSDNSSSNKDRLSIGRLCWTAYEAPMVPEVVRTGLTVGQYGTICLNKAVNAGDYEGATFYSLAYKEQDDSRVYADEVVTNLEAGMPYIFVATAEEIVVTYTGEAVSEAGNYNGLFGTFEAMNFTTSGDAEKYILSAGKLYQCGDGYSLAANRAYVELVEVSTHSVQPAPARRRLVFSQGNQVPTVLENTTMEMKSQKVIYRGELFIIRDNQMYNAQGQLVKE